VSSLGEAWSRYQSTRGSLLTLRLESGSYTLSAADVKMLKDCGISWP
jgi:hypothetical protein